MARGDSALSRAAAAGQVRRRRRSRGAGWRRRTSSCSTATSRAASRPPRGRNGSSASELADARKNEFAYQKDLAGAHAIASSASASSRRSCRQHRVPGVPGSLQIVANIAGVSLRRGRRAGGARAVLRAVPMKLELSGRFTRSRSSSTASGSSTASSTWRTSRSPTQAARATRSWSRSRRLATAFRTLPEGDADEQEADKRGAASRAAEASDPHVARSLLGRCARLRLPSCVLAASQASRGRAGAKPPAADSRLRPRRRLAAPRRAADAGRPRRSTFQEDEFAESERSRDPFRSLRRLFVEEARGTVKSQREVLLDQYSIDELKLVGIVTRIQPAKAMLVDPSGKGHVVQRGQFVGRPEIVQAAGATERRLRDQLAGRSHPRRRHRAGARRSRESRRSQRDHASSRCAPKAASSTTSRLGRVV